MNLLANKDIRWFQLQSPEGETSINLLYLMQELRCGNNMTEAENRMDPFNIGLYIIEAGLVAVVIYAMAVLTDLFKPVL